MNKIRVTAIVLFCSIHLTHCTQLPLIDQDDGGWNRHLAVVVVALRRPIRRLFPLYRFPTLSHRHAAMICRT
jgi:hypothetical protein